MKNWKTKIYSLVLGMSIVTFVSPALADEIIVKTAPGSKWVSGSNTSNGRIPLDVEVKKGDILVIQLPSTVLAHGIVTIDRKPWEGDNPVSNVQEKKEVVAACGQPDSNSVFLEQLDCSEQPASFGVTSKGKLRLRVKDNFAGDVHFWCTEHFAMMWGTIRLKP
jgi:hypothetical protein